MYDAENRLVSTAGGLAHPFGWGAGPPLSLPLFGATGWEPYLGNLNKKQACAAGSPCEGKPLGEWLDQTSDSKNRFSGFCYDAAGNLIRWALCPGADMTYDAENRLVSVAGVTYTYSADGNRVKKSTGTVYWYGQGGEMLAESDAAGVMTDEYVYFNGRRVARRLASGDIHYYFADHLGSSRVVLTSTGSYVEDLDFYPFGGLRSFYSSGSKYKFTGKERDPESNLDYFGARHYSSSLGRFLQPDEFAGGPVDAFSSNDPLPDSPLPYADITNPQSLNKYTYTYNNPLRYTDPNGHDPRIIGAILGGGAGAVVILYRTGQVYFTGKGSIPTNKEIFKTIGIGAAIGATIGAAQAGASPKEVPVPTEQPAANEGRKNGDENSNSGNVEGGAQGESTGKQKSSAQLRKEYEAQTGEPWPKDADTGRNQDVHHRTAKADGGTDTLGNIEPKPRKEHIEHHREQGDFKRWGARAHKPKESGEN